MMASTDDGRVPPKESSGAAQSSNRDADTSSPPPPPPPTTSYPTQAPPGPAYPPPHMMYYPPPQHAYPPQGYAAYPTEYPHGNNYPAAPYYGAQPPYRSAPAGGGGFFRGFILCSCVIFTSFFIASLIVALVLRPQIPICKVLSLSVANFNTTPALAGDWDTRFTIENPNNKLKGYFSDFKVDVVYKYGVVAVNFVPGFELDKHQQREMDVKAISNGANVLEKTMLDDMEKDRGTGSVMFALRISTTATFKTGSMSTKNSAIVAICEGLKVVFQNNTGTGTLDNGGKPIDCQLYV